MDNINVKAAPGLQVPMEEDARKYITDTTSVPNTAYYRRRLADGDLVRVDPAPAPDALPESAPPTDITDPADSTPSKPARPAGANRAKGE